jgi:hypothetical protein
VRIEAWQWWGGVGRSFQEDLARRVSLMFCDRNEKDDDAECPRRSLAAGEVAREKAKPTQLRNEALLNCVSLRSQLDCDVTCGAVKGRDERPFWAPLTAPQVTPELGKTDKTGDAVSRPSCHSSLLSDPNAKFSVEVCRKLSRTRNGKKTRDGGKVDLTSHTKPKRRAATSAT